MSSVFPDKWKHAIVTPLPKKPNSKSVNDLRPISQLPLPSKILEKLIINRLVNYIENNNIINAAQHGFRKNHSTLTAVGEYLNMVYKNYNDRVTTFSLFLDYKKAFDTVSHPILLQKLHDIGLSDNTCNWFRSYLTNRTQAIAVNDKISKTRTITYGVPQGSTAGPILFIIYITDIVHHVGNCSITLYADDAVISSTDPNALQTALNSVSQWCIQNCLTINETKTQWMYIGPTPPPSQFHINNKLIEEVHTFKYLGVTLDNALSYYQHINKLFDKTCSAQAGAGHTLALFVLASDISSQKQQCTSHLR